MTKKMFPGIYSSLGKIASFVTQQSRAAGLNESEAYQVQLAVDEACSNIIEHAYGGEGIGDIAVECHVSKGQIEVILQDHGKKFDPDGLPEPQIGVSLEKLRSRGAGVFLMRKVMDVVEFDFSRTGTTILRMVKRKG